MSARNRARALPLVTITAPGNALLTDLRQLVIDAVHRELNWQSAVWAEPFIPYDFRWMIYRGHGSRAEAYLGAVEVRHMVPDVGRIEDARQVEFRTF